MLQHIADEYNQSGLANVVKYLNRFQPDPKYTCTMAVISPFTGRLELVTIPCDEKYNISSLICLKETTIGEKVIKLLLLVFIYYLLVSRAGYLLISNYYSYYYHYFIYLSSTILFYANHVTLSVWRRSSIELWREV